MASIKLNNVTVEHPIFNTGTMSLRHQLVSLGTGGTLSAHSKNMAIVTALKDINLSLKDGDRLGLIGHNGSGKSTLLRTMAGIYSPSIGSVVSSGKISTVFGLGAGMSLELNGYENIIRMSMLLGLSKEKAMENFAEITEFTELGDFMNVPVRTYSMGMLTRLLFAVATSTHPEILLIDEVIGAGDRAFQEKAFKRMADLIGKSSVSVIASHSNEVIKKYCNKVAELSHGKLISMP